MARSRGHLAPVLLATLCLAEVAGVSAALWIAGYGVTVTVTGAGAAIALLTQLVRAKTSAAAIAYTLLGLLLPIVVVILLLLGCDFEVAAGAAGAGWALLAEILRRVILWTSHPTGDPPASRESNDHS